MTEAAVPRAVEGGDQAADDSAPASVPPDVVRDAVAALAARQPEVVVAELVRDSRDSETSGAVRLEFEGGGLRISVQVRPEQPVGRGLLVHVRGPVDGSPEVRSWHGEVHVLDDAGGGCWSSTVLPRGPMSVWLTAGGTALRTAWSRL